MSSYLNEQKLIKRFDFTQRKPLTEIIYLGLKEVILDGTLPLGERINENSLAVELSCSRTPIRKAVNCLVADGLVGHISGYGAYVKSVNVQRIKEIYQIRKLLEGLLYEEVEKKLQKEELVFLKASVKKMIFLEQMNQIEELVLELNKFNQKIHEVAQMTTLTHLLEELTTYFRNFRNFSFSTRSRRIAATKEHEMIVRLLEAKEPNYLKHAVEQHIDHAERAAIRFFTSKEFNANILKKNFYSPQKKIHCGPDCELFTRKDEINS